MNSHMDRSGIIIAVLLSAFVIAAIIAGAVAAVDELMTPILPPPVVSPTPEVSLGIYRIVLPDGRNVVTPEGVICEGEASGGELLLVRCWRAGDMRPSTWLMEKELHRIERVGDATPSG